MNQELYGIPLVPLRGMIVFPGTVVNLDIGREKSIKAVETAMAGNRELVVVSQRNDEMDNPELSDLYPMGTLVKIKQLLRLPGGIIRILVQGVIRVTPVTLHSEGEYYQLDGFITPTTDDAENEVEAYRRLCVKKFEAWAKETGVLSEEVIHKVDAVVSADEAADLMASALPIRQEVAQELLATVSLVERYNKMVGILNTEMQIVDLENNINNQVRHQMEKAQKEYFLREKIKAIHDELGDKFDPDEEAIELRERLNELGLPKDIHDRIDKEIGRYERMPQMMPEANILRNYLDWVLELPWVRSSEDRLDINVAAKSLDEDHYGLEKIKDRILEFLAVRQLAGNEQKGSILCLVGPPGVGKTSLAASIAKAMNRKFVRASLGGVRDEAEVRGHRRTYVGALPGRMIQGIKNAGTNNPVFLLDEIDKLGADYKGDPSSALLEVLDPEQNSTFRDHYIEIPFDFSKVFWITTANVASNIPAPLMDRMEVIELSSYTEDEKLEIAKRYLVPKQRKKNGLDSKVKLSDAVLRAIISDYTREAGVRTLEKTIAKVFRKVAYQIVKGAEQTPKVTVKNLSDYLGAPIFIPDKLEKKPQVGLVCGLAWTSVGGVVLPCEATTMPGTGKLILTGSLGNVMKESGQAALSYIRHHVKKLGISDEEFYKKLDIHVHLPEGATPKDGPSAGITMTLAMISALTDVKIRSDIAMTGEVTIRGNVLPIGGLKEKLFAALRHGMKEVLIPKGNVKDIQELPEAIKEGLIITPVETMDEVLAKALISNG